LDFGAALSPGRTTLPSQGLKTTFQRAGVWGQEPRLLAVPLTQVPGSQSLLSLHPRWTRREATDAQKPPTWVECPPRVSDCLLLRVIYPSAAGLRAFCPPPLAMAVTGHIYMGSHLETQNLKRAPHPSRKRMAPFLWRQVTPHCGVWRRRVGYVHVWISGPQTC